MCVFYGYLLICIGFYMHVTIFHIYRCLHLLKNRKPFLNPCYYLLAESKYNREV